MLPRIYSFLGRWLHFHANFLRKGEFLVPYCGFCCGNGGFVAEREGDVLRRNRGCIAEILRRYFREIGACSWHHTSQAEAQKKENHTLSEDLCGFLTCYPKVVFPF